MDNRLFRRITPSSLDRMLVCSKSKMARYNSGEIIFCQQDAATKLYVLLEGTVAIVKNFPSGRKNTLFSVEAGSVFGENFLFENTQYHHDAEAVTDVCILEIPWKFFYCFCDSSCDHHRQLVQNMLEILCQKEALVERKLHIISAPSLRSRIAIWLLDSADKDGTVILKMNREALADFLGTTRPSLSRELMRMKEDGLLNIQKNKIQIANPDELETIYC